MRGGRSGAGPGNKGRNTLEWAGTGAVTEIKGINTLDWARAVPEAPLYKEPPATDAVPSLAGGSFHSNIKNFICFA
ncbi:hypothetical protein AMQ83_01080 [Paenibacillus riograndensis]|nr:hypothetical protein AMQ83_01080 [Paenibacillus riograndensis]